MNRVLEDWSHTVRREAPGPVADAMAYSLAAPGKRLRPALVLAAYRALGGAGDAVELAAAVEVVHTYSLVHDDLPCMDDDDLRRGRPTTHREFGVATATEAGFRLVPLSARVLATGARRLSLEKETLREIARELYRAAGVHGMIGGQVLDLEAEGRDVGRAELRHIHEMKTGALMTASAVIGAVAAGAATDVVEAVRAYGRELGLAFQIVDDVLDATATSDELGKTAGKDAQQRKATFAAVLGLDRARATAAHHARRAVDQLGAVGVDSGLLTGLAKLVIERRS